MIGLRCRTGLLPALLLGTTLLGTTLPGTALWGQNLKQFERKVTEFTLANGLHFILVERHEAPVISFRTWVDAGSLHDPAGSTGLAHMFEHMAFKGTETIGTTDWASEKKALDAIEEAYDRLQAERNKGPRADSSRLDSLESQLRSLIDRAQVYSRSNDFSSILGANGAVGLNANTLPDHTEYQCSLPSNRLELWFLMESQRFLTPVFREFYKERDVVQEEQRLRVGSNPQGLLLQDFLAAAFEAHPIHNPGIGWPSDIANLRSTDARAFYERYYTASNMIIGIAGDVNPEEARRLAERYFGVLPSRPTPPMVEAVEPAQRGTRRIQVEWVTQPLLVWGYKRPDQRDPDDPVFRVMGLLLSGRTGLLYKELVEKQRIALEAQVVSAFPNARYPSVFSFMVAPSKDHTLEENEKALTAVVQQLQSQKVDDETLNRARNKARAELIAQLDSNPGLAALLPAFYAAYGDWRKLFTSLGDLNKVTGEDIQRVARRYLVPTQRTEGYTIPPTVQAAPRGGR